MSYKFYNDIFGVFPIQYSGVAVINGTDAPVEPGNPEECFYVSVAMKTVKGIHWSV